MYAKKQCAWTALSVLLISLLAVCAPSARAAERGPYNLALSWTQDTSTTMTVTWMDETARDEVVQVVRQIDHDKTGFDGCMEIAAACKDVSLDGSGVWHYEATAAGLEPGTAYVYRVGSESAWSESHTFTTDDPDAQTLTFAYLGDVQPANDTQAEYALWSELVQTMYERNPELSFAILGGDDVNSGISIEQFDLLFAAAEPVFSSVPLLSTIGNHESNFIGGKAELFLDLFALPENGPEGFTEEIFSFDAANCHVLVLNSWIFSGEQDLTEEDYERVNDWIKADLAASTADWQIVVTHVPVYALHSDTTSTVVKENWAPIFEQYGVDLVLEGHQHVYSRSWPMYQGAIDYENGIPYIMGVSGQKFYDSADETFAARTVYNVANYQLIQIDGNSLTVQSLDASGSELDFAAITQREISVSRGEYVETLWRAAGSPKPAGTSPFADTEEDAAVWAYESGILLGYGDGLAGWDDPILAWQISLILERME